MLHHIICVALAAAALTFAGCNKNNEYDANGSGSTAAETTTTETGAADGSPAAIEGSAGEAAAQPAPATQPQASSEVVSQEVTLPGGTKYVDVAVGNGAQATPGNRVTVHYTGTLTDGTQFDSSVGRQPFTFTLGANEVIKGWDEGVAGMKVGGKRKLTIPPEQAYGSDPTGPIPANSTLLFDVELLSVN